MRLRGTRKRIEALERALPPRPDRDGPDDETVRAALLLLSNEDLQALESAAEAAPTLGDERDERKMHAQRAFARAVTQVRFSDRRCA